jgi:hypothetical protein
MLDSLPITMRTYGAEWAAAADNQSVKKGTSPNSNDVTVEFKRRAKPRLSKAIPRKRQQCDCGNVRLSSRENLLFLEKKPEAARDSTRFRISFLGDRELDPHESDHL